jgi:hypothetical protein
MKLWTFLVPLISAPSLISVDASKNPLNAVASMPLYKKASVLAGLKEAYRSKAFNRNELNSAKIWVGLTLRKDRNTKSLLDNRVNLSAQCHLKYALGAQGVQANVYEIIRQIKQDRRFIKFFFRSSQPDLSNGLLAPDMQQCINEKVLEYKKIVFAQPKHVSNDVVRYQRQMICLMESALGHDDYTLSFEGITVTFKFQPLQHSYFSQYQQLREYQLSQAEMIFGFIDTYKKVIAGCLLVGVSFFKIITPDQE